MFEKMTTIQILFLFSIVLLAGVNMVKIVDLENKRFILTKTDDSFLYEKEDYLFHVFDLDELYNQIKSIRYERPTVHHRILIKKAMKYFEQLGINKIEKRAINVLGSGIKWITGMPDHSDLIELQEKINTLIDNNNKLTNANSKTAEILKNVHDGEMNTYILTEIIEELQNIVLTVNMAKNDQINTLALNLHEIEDMMKIEKNQIPIINILEYSTVHICKIKNSIILVIKYPIIECRCEHYQITTLEMKHGKLLLDKQISRCKNIFRRTKKCVSILNTNICQTEKEDDCTLKILQNQNNAKCVINQEENEQIQFISSGHMVLSGEHQVDNVTINGVYLIDFEENVTIDSVLYMNLEKKAKEYIITHHEEKFEILKLIETEKQNLKFGPIKTLKKFLIPLEEHPVKTIITVIIYFLMAAVIFWSMSKCYNMYQKYIEVKTRREYLSVLRAEYNRRGLPLEEM